MFRQRAVSAAVLVPLLIVVLLLGEPFIALAVAGAVLLGGVETFRLLRAAGYPALPWLGTAIGLALVAEAAAPADLREPGLLVAAVGLVLAAVGGFAEPDPRTGFAALVATAFGGLYIGLLSFVVRLGALAPDLPSGAPAAPLGPVRAWILLLVLTVWAYDTAAYLVGSRFGRRRFLVHISPSKTYAGLAGGLAGAVLVGLAAGWALAGSPLLLAGFGLLVGLAAQAGDLAESLLKRAAGAKDSGTLIPGHGGMLDRVDSFLFAAPIATLYAAWLVR
ncbi:MAG TPA: phosphatidate cytidylyltransferase [Candidatus Limnocylindrales bacterium]